MIKKSNLAKDIMDTDYDEVQHNKLLTPLVRAFRLDNGRDAQFTSIDGMKIVVKLLKEQNERITSRSKRTSFGGSSSANCMREQMINFMADVNETQDIDYQLSLIFEDGNWRNLKWIVEFQRMGILKEYEVTRYSEKINLSWTPDARVDLSAYYGEEYTDVPVEIKGMNEWEFKQFRQRSGRARFGASRIMQIHAYMIAANLDHWLIFAENKNTQDIEEYWCKRNPSVVKLLQAKYRYMLRARDREALPAIECAMNPSDSMFNRCSRNEDCSKLMVQTYPSLQPMKDKVKLESKAKRAFV